jgi:hypothetical protein
MLHPTGAQRRGLIHAEFVVLLIIVIFICSVAPIGVQELREAAAKTTCVNNLKTVGIAVHAYVDGHKRVPPAWNPDSIFSDQASKQWLSAGPNVIGTAHFQLLPFMEQEQLYKNSKNDAVKFDFRTGTTAKTILPIFLCPADPSNNGNTTSYGYASCNYLANLWVFDPRIPANLIQAMPDGTSNTIMFCEGFKTCPYPSAAPQREIAWANHPQFGAGRPSDAPVFGWENFTRGNTFSESAYILTKGPHVAGQLPNYCVPYFDLDTGIKAPPDCVAYQIAPNLACSPCDPHLVQGAHKDSIQVGLGDGSVRGVTKQVAVTSWVVACVPNDGWPLASDYPD